MPDFQLNEKTLETNIDRSADSFLVYDNSAQALRRTNINSALDVTSHPVGIDDVQTLTQKTITAPNISSPVLSGTVTGTYTLGGTPTFPSSVATLTGIQTLTNKTLTSPTINTATIANPTLTVDTISEYTSAAGVTIDGVLLKDSKMNGSYLTDTTVGNTQLALGVAVQQSSSLYSAVATGTTIIPLDDTIPQNTEGTEFMTVSITPKSATNILCIQVNVCCSHTSGSGNIVVALFQDTTANALAVSQTFQATATGPVQIPLIYTMTAGLTISTTFKIRIGSTVAGTLTLNGQSGTRQFGAIPKSSILVTEYKAA